LHGVPRNEDGVPVPHRYMHRLHSDLARPMEADQVSAAACVCHKGWFSRRCGSSSRAFPRTVCDASQLRAGRRWPIGRYPDGFVLANLCHRDLALLWLTDHRDEASDSGSQRGSFGGAESAGLERTPLTMSPPAPPSWARHMARDGIGVAIPHAVTPIR
jgi:hypothetical protein